MIGNELKIKASACNLHTYLQKYQSLIDTYINAQFKEEDFKNTSHKQYDYAIISYTFKFISLLSYMANFYDYSKLYEKYNLDKTKQILARKGIILDEILTQFNMPNSSNDDYNINSQIINTSPIQETHPGIFVTLGNIKGDSSHVPTTESFNIYTGVLEQYDLDSDEVENILQFDANGNNIFATVDFSEFEDMYPVIILPPFIRITSIRESSTGNIITTEYIKSNVNISPDGTNVYDMYIYTLPTLSAMFETYVLELELIRL